MNCHDAGELLDAFHDRELDVVASREVQSHLRECPACSAALDRKGALRSVMAERAPYYAAPASLRAKLTQAAPTRPKWWYQWWPALVPACVLLALAIWRMAPGPAPDVIAKEVAAAHVRSLLAEHLMDVPSSDRHTVKPWFTGKLDFAPEVQDLAASGFALAGGRLDYIDGRTVAALVYRHRQHTVNVFTWPAAGDDESPRRESVQGFTVIHWVRHGMNWWAVSDAGADELAQLPKLL